MPVFARRAPKASWRWLQFALWTVLSLVLIFQDHQRRALAPLHSTLAVIVTPLRWAAALPADLFNGVSGYFEGNTVLREDNRRLKAANLMLRAELERYQSLRADDAHLRQLLAAAPQVSVRAVVARVVDVGFAPFSRKLVLDRGRTSGIYLGQPVIDANGIMGQVSEVDRYSSIVILITDPNHEIPVQDVRTGQRALVQGTGASDTVAVPDLTASAEIRPGDLLVSSGLGGIFPAGYPVATVLSVKHDPNEAFLTIEARPAAKLNSGHKVLVIWPKNGAPS